MSSIPDKVRAWAKTARDWAAIPVLLGGFFLAVWVIQNVAEWLSAQINEALNAVGRGVAEWLPVLADRYHVPTQELAAAAVAVVLALLVIWLAPTWAGAMGRVRALKGLKEDEQVRLELEARKSEAEARKTLVQIVGGLFAIIGLYVTYQSYRTSEEKSTADRLAKSAELLGSHETAVRLGAVYSLERMTRESPELHRQGTEMLTAFVRQQTASSAPTALGPAPEAVHPPADVQAALNVVARRNARFDLGEDVDPTYARTLRSVLLNFSGTNLAGAWFIHADLQLADFRGANLDHAVFWGCQLQGATFQGAALREASFSGSDVSDAQFAGAHLEGADLSGAAPLPDHLGFKDAIQDGATKLPPHSPTMGDLLGPK